MKRLIKTHGILAISLSVVASVFCVYVIVDGATTINSGITTSGTVTTTGVLTADSASTSNDLWVGNLIADDDDSIFMDASGTEYLMWDDSIGEFALSDGLDISGRATATSATTSDSFYAGGYASTTGGIWTQGNFHVGGTSVMDGAVTLGSNLDVNGNATATAATTSDSFYAGGYASTTGGIWTQGDLHVGGDLTIDGHATSVSASYISLYQIKFIPSATPTSVHAGQCFMDNTDNNDQLNCYDGSAWHQLW